MEWGVGKGKGKREGIGGEGDGKEEGGIEMRKWREELPRKLSRSGEVRHTHTHIKATKQRPHNLEESFVGLFSMDR